MSRKFFSAGDIITCRVPHTDIIQKLSNTPSSEITEDNVDLFFKKRPALVIRHSDRDVYVAKVTTEYHRSAIRIDSPEDLEEGRLNSPVSYVRIDKAMPLQKTASMRKICRLKDNKVREVEQELIALCKMT